MARLIFFCGHAGAGKTTIAKRALPLLHHRSGESYCLLDKDTVYGAYSSKVMGILTGDPNDRDSPLFLEKLRDQEYQGLFDIARENLAMGTNTILVGPFSRELKEGLLFDHRKLKLPSDAAIKVVWVSISEALAKERIIRRGNALDAYKLAHWDDYRKRRFDPDPKTFPQLRYYDNSAEPGAAANLQFEGLLNELLR
jgi:predicted kinase